jgi:hypothetical protein
MGYIRANGAIGISLREHEKAHSPLGQSTPCECTCTGERERSRMRQRRHKHRCGMAAGSPNWSAGRISLRRSLPRRGARLPRDLLAPRCHVEGSVGARVCRWTWPERPDFFVCDCLQPPPPTKVSCHRSSRRPSRHPSRPNGPRAISQRPAPQPARSSSPRKSGSITMTSHPEPYWRLGTCRDGDQPK